VGTNAPSSTLQVTGSFSLPIKTINSNYTASAGDYTLIATNNFQITVKLPDPATCKGRIYVIKRYGGSVVVDPVAGQVDGNNTYTISSDDRSVMFQSDGNSMWYIISDNY
jgi:hypothetical protein